MTIVSLVAFLTHFVWENVQCRLFFEHGSYDASWQGMVAAAAGDVVLTWIVYGAVAIALWSARWGTARSWSAAAWLVLLMSSTTVAIVVEARALAAGAWSYSAIAPLLSGTDISLVPIVQLVLLTPLALISARRLTLDGPQRGVARTYLALSGASFPRRTEEPNG